MTVATLCTAHGMWAGTARRIVPFRSGLSGFRHPFPPQHRHQAHRSKASIGIPMPVADDAFLGKSGLQVGPIGPLILDEHVEIHAMRRQIVEADLQDGPQQARSNPAPGVSDRYSPEPDTLVPDT